MATSTPTAPRVFLDSSVLFAAAYSAKASARDLLLAAIQGRIVLVLSSYVINETERNLLRRAPHAHPGFLRFRKDLPYQLSDPPDALVADTARIVVGKDAPIIAAARRAQTTLVATYDRKDLLSKRQEILAAFGVTVATPEEILANL
ncbi:MAG: PIN domain-containing protein [Chloroflexi bacterium]|nr:PIN domain-containing protein [Chloroflexota bacterium]